jgi:putative SOS response-associated peptidase YedK
MAHPMVNDVASHRLPAIFPNGRAPVVRLAPDGVRELTMMRWGFPPPVIPGKPRNPYLTNVRNTDSRYWRTYLRPLAQANAF